MKINTNRIDQLGQPETPFYYYDMDLLKRTLDSCALESRRYGYHVHYALKANSNPKILDLISRYGFGADCVSGNEITRAMKSGFEPSSILFAGVGKTDKEIRLAIEHDIACINCESIEEIQVVNQMAGRMNKTVRIAVRINPDVEAKTHKNISTGLDENKFGIGIWQLPIIRTVIQESMHVQMIGIHFHIGSQITDMDVFKSLCMKVNQVLDYCRAHNMGIENVNVGGGLGIDYQHPESNPIPDFASYFRLFNEHLHLSQGQQVHFELGRSIVGQSGCLITRVLYKKPTRHTEFVIVDAGMTELMRPALYQAQHKIEALSYQDERLSEYHVAGPICETTDSFADSVYLPEISRGDLLAIKSAGAYGEAMINGYNLRDPAKSYFSTDV